MLRNVGKVLSKSTGSAQITVKRFASIENSCGWESTIGLEVHAQISVESKLFSSGMSTYGLPTNIGVNLFDAAIPGTLPVLNKKAVELAVLTSLALNCHINEVSYFDRKHYFYSDLPNGYQITQQRAPIAQNGHISYAIFNPEVHKKPYYKVSKIKQIQLEQDSGKSYHDSNSKQTFIDLNRSGIALMEIVFEPDIDNAEEATSVVKELCSILLRLGSCSCKMEEGALRVDANISLRRKGGELGIRTEVKNIGSIRGVANAINYEISRQLQILENGGIVANETMAWDATKKKTVVLRDKEKKHDYRYMPEPNLPPLRIIIDEDSEKYHKNVKNKDSILDLRRLKYEIPQLPNEERDVLLKKYRATDLIAYQIVNQPIIYKLCIDILTENTSRNINDVYKILMITLLTALNRNNMKLSECTIPSVYFGELVDMRMKTLSPLACEEVLREILNGDSRSPAEIVKEKNLTILSESELKEICKEVINCNEKPVNDYLKGKHKILNYLMRKVSEVTGSRATPDAVEQTLRELLEIKKKKMN